MEKKDIHVYLTADEFDLLEQLRLRDGVVASKNAVVAAAIREAAERRGLTPRST